MKKIGAAKFKEQCLSLIDEVGSEGLVITKHGRPVATLMPFGADSKRLIGALATKVRIKGNNLSTGVKWHAES